MKDEVIEWGFSFIDRYLLRRFLILVLVCQSLPRRSSTNCVLELVLDTFYRSILRTRPFHVLGLVYRIHRIVIITPLYAY